MRTLFRYGATINYTHYLRSAHFSEWVSLIIKLTSRFSNKSRWNDKYKWWAGHILRSLSPSFCFNARSLAEIIRDFRRRVIMHRWPGWTDRVYVALLFQLFAPRPSTPRAMGVSFVPRVKIRQALSKRRSCHRGKVPVSRSFFVFAHRVVLYFFFYRVFLFFIPYPIRFVRGRGLSNVRALLPSVCLHSFVR